ncbi:hypothetical protein ACJVC5_07730 [Peredibacter sp. HCB2-198]|uniref:hypothetical protein n=1 Tax=Peredibacter sp. HCB2-198 TaxID=3383025 RepID=UPI0038B6937D
MKFLATLTLLAVTTSAALAADRAIYDIQYLPNAGTTFGFTDLNYTTVKLESDADTDISGYTFSQTLGHSLSDRFSLAAELNYANIESDPEGDTTTDETGISDLTLSAKYRLIDSDLRLDLIGGGVASLGDSDVESNGDSNHLQGGNSLFLGAQVGKKSEAFQWAVLAQVTHNFKATTDVEGFGDVKDDANNELLLRGDILNKLGEKSYLRSHLDMRFTEEFDDNADNTTASTTTYTIGTQYQHICSSDFMAKVGVDYTKVNTLSGQIDDLTGWNFTIGANYQF